MTHHSLNDWCLGMRCSAFECHYVFPFLIIWYSAILLWWLWLFLGFLCPFCSFWPAHLGFLKLCNSGSGCFCPSLDIPFEYWIGYFTWGLFYVIFRYFTMIFGRGLAGFATDCSCVFGAVGWPIASCMLVTLVWNDSGLVNLT